MVERSLLIFFAIFPKGHLWNIILSISNLSSNVIYPYINITSLSNTTLVDTFIQHTKIQAGGNSHFLLQTKIRLIKKTNGNEIEIIQLHFRFDLIKLFLEERESPFDRNSNGDCFVYQALPLGFYLGFTQLLNYLLSNVCIFWIGAVVVGTDCSGL